MSMLEKQPVSITDPDLDIESGIRNRITRYDLLSDATKIIGAQEIASGVPHTDVERGLEQMRTPGRSRGQVRTTINVARNIISNRPNQ